MLIITLVLLNSCAPKSYKHLQRINGNADCIGKFLPKYERVLYRTTVNVAGNHLSGILLIKEMPDSSTRLVFANEAGFKFFDFEFSKTGDFRVYSIIKKMDKKSVRKTLKKDFQLILMNKPVSYLKQYKFKGKKEDEVYFAYNEGKDYYYYITNNDCTSFVRLERGSITKKVTAAFMQFQKDGLPESIDIQHKNFNFEISLKRIEENAE
ncbi:MAG: hypothetical protein IPH58_08725 [Sphingobacteriales bacterium]|nr:hypothetical protein [Sphingobacteriales bacterium]